ncbi:MAG: hypothetical protein IKK04_06935 [Bacteroidales bacterium]|nr:hypothetical protein [Bacteroidales bacterium]
MKENNKKEYETPQVEQMAARVEKGFVVSSETEGKSGQTESYRKGSTDALFT